MNFETTQEQAMIEDTLDRLLTDHWDMRKAHDPQERDRMRDAVWAQLAATGLLGALLPEQWEGIEGGPREWLAMARTVGRHGADLPLLSSLMLGAGMLLELPAGRRPVAPAAVAGGECRLAAGVLEAGRRYETTPTALRARESDGGWILDGAKHHVLDAGQAHVLLLLAALDGTEEPALFAVPAGAGGPECREYPAVGGAMLSHVECRELRLSGEALLARGDEARRCVELGMGRARFWACAETLGACEAALSQTIDYLRIREQFGRRLASFQALQHRLADAHAELELLRSLVFGVSDSLGDAPSGARAGRDLAAACALAGEVGDLIGREAIQLHGAIGMTRELGVGRYLMRIDFLWRLLGDGQFQRERLLASLPPVGMPQ